MRRAEGGCEFPYAREDLALARCMVCGRRGHLMCGEEARPAAPRARLSCYNCGEGGHTAAECARVRPLRRGKCHSRQAQRSTEAQGDDPLVQRPHRCRVRAGAPAVPTAAPRSACHVSAWFRSPVEYIE